MTARLAEHAQMNQFPVQGNQLLVGGKSLGTLAGRVGKTPFYAYDSAVIRECARKVREILPIGMELHYAVKANPMPEVVQLLSGLTDGFDVASGRELSIALDTGVRPGCISFAGPGKSDDELDMAINAGIVIIMESPGEMKRIARLADLSGKRPSVAVRVNPAFELKSSGMKMGGGAKPFGIDEEQVPALLRDLATLDLDFCGFHIFSGSQNLKPEAIVEAQNNTLALACQLAGDAPSAPRWINIGGGLGVPYFPGDSPLDLAQIADNLLQLCARASSVLPGATLVMELGRYLVAESGVYVCEIIDRKTSRGQEFLVTNGGLHHHLSASGNFGQVIRKNYPLCLGNRVKGSTEREFNVVGPLCTPLDILGDRVMLPEDAGPGDLIVVFQSGAYGYSASPLGFLSHPVPEQVVV